eukprot:CAMPEP_0113917346 /NCGR_PEP_ID=MMETSP0780_2-20120614/32683_1 /TAXON_ID=652834 /ORGANISM="Palpitomonas bilix" /LENGTH=167 /DNA_ID=CAMNT_0000916909 /DNA_START=1 /DNA_END=504 /DNA_ORIENTATION=- /assembly_acc=CAM_ASM_000599
MTLKPMKALVAAETIRIVGQMDGPDEIVENLFLGNEYNASDVSKLKSLGIKRVVNVTLEIKNFFPSEFEYMRIAVLDTPNEDLLSRFSEVIQFIDEAIDHGDAVLVHCHRGVSRSASMVIAYLMKARRFSLRDATRLAKDRRSIVDPNRGFMSQLRLFEARIRTERQ